MNETGLAAGRAGAVDELRTAGWAAPRFPALPVAGGGVGPRGASPALPAHAGEQLPPGRAAVSRSAGRIGEAERESVAASLAGLDGPGLRAWLVAMAVGALLPLAWLYHRIHGRRAAEHPHRQRTLGYVRDHPGCDIAELARHLGLSYKSAKHHAEVLERAGLLRIDRDGARTCLSLHGDEARASWASTLRHPLRRNVALLVQGQPGARQSQVARVLGVGRSTLHPHVRALVEAGIVREVERRLYASSPPAGWTLHEARP